MAATKTKKNPPDPRAQYSNIPKGLIACARVRCLGTYHRIGLHPSGQLVFFDHSKEDRRRLEIIEELGGNKARCLEILKQWRTGAPDVLTTPRMLYQEYPHDLNVGGRLQRRARRLRRDSQVALPAYFPDPQDIRRFQGQLNNYGSGRGGRRHNIYAKVIEWLAKELERRGWDALAIELMQCCGNPCGYVRAQFPTFDGKCTWEEIGCIYRFASHYKLATLTNEFVTTFSDLEDINIRLVADVVERGFLDRSVRQYWINDSRRHVKDFDAKIGEIKESVVISDCPEIGVFGRDHNGTASLHISFHHLTLPAIKMMIENYQQLLKPKFDAIIRSNDKRLVNQYREPPPPPKMEPRCKDPVPNYLEAPQPGLFKIDENGEVEED